MSKTKAKQPEAEDKRPPAEKQGAYYMEQINDHIRLRRGQFLRDEDGSLHVILENQRIPLNFDNSNERLARLMLRATGVSTLSAGARSGIQRLQVIASEQAGKMSFRKFSALSADGNRLYVPLEDGQTLLITSEEIKSVANGKNEDDFWVEHPLDSSLVYSIEVNPQIALEHFERLLVESQSCAISEMKWLVAMHEGLFPYIRDEFPARFMLVHQGASQQGKTTGAQRFTMLHGLGQVLGDYTVASLGNVGDLGLLVLDNKEQANFNQPLIDFCLYLATGAERARSSTDGQLRRYKHRPVGVITTIEGVWKEELKKRCVTVEYVVKGTESNRGAVEREIQQRRHEIGSGLMIVLQRYIQIKGQHSTPNPISEFKEHFTALCDLLRAYGEVARKDEGWAERIITKWDEVISNREEDEEDELEQPLLRVFAEVKNYHEFDTLEVVFEGQKGKLYITTCNELLTALQKLRLYDRTFPKDAKGLSQRLHSAKFKAFRFLNTDSVEALKRSSTKRPIGFFFEDDEPSRNDVMTIGDIFKNRQRHNLTR